MGDSSHGKGDGAVNVFVLLKTSACVLLEFIHSNLQPLQDKQCIHSMHYYKHTRLLANILRHLIHKIFYIEH